MRDLGELHCVEEYRYAATTKTPSEHSTKPPLPLPVPRLPQISQKKAKESMGCQHSTPITKIQPGGQLSGIRVVGISGRTGALLDQITIHYVIPEGEEGPASLSSTTSNDTDISSGGGNNNPEEASDMKTKREYKRSFGSDTGGEDFARVDVSKPGTTISLRSNAEVNAITINEVRYGSDGGYSWNEALCLRQGEYIHKVEVRIAGGSGVVGYLELETNMGSIINGGRCVTNSAATTTQKNSSNGTTTTTAFANSYCNTTYVSNTSGAGGGGGNGWFSGGGGDCGGGGGDCDGGGE